MINSLYYIIIAALGLSVLVFIHELGHYLMARRVKMRVEVFSIGFGKPIVSWVHQGVKWQVCYFLFGGYVKIAGMEKEGKKEPHEIKDGFFGSTPLNRIKVAIMGPLVNIVFALMIFALIWGLGGRSAPFAEYTKIIGYVDPKSELAEKGVKPGDLIETYGTRPFRGVKDLWYSGALKGDSISISGEKRNYVSGVQTPFNYELNSYFLPEMYRGIRTVGILSPASYLYVKGFDHKTGSFSPLHNSGVNSGDRIVWANGEVIFSAMQLNQIVNQSSAFIIINREGKRIPIRVPLVPIGDLHLSDHERDEFIDWKRALGIHEPLENLLVIPYDIDSLGQVNGKFQFIDSDLVEENASRYKVKDLDQPLQEGDKIVAVYGEKVTSGLSLFDKVKERKISLIVQKGGVNKDISWLEEDELFFKSVNWANLAEFAALMGTDDFKQESAEFKLLKPIVPITYSEFQLRQKGGKEDASLQEQDFSHKHKFISLGALLSDQAVIYNPNPFVSMRDVLTENWYNLTSLAKGSLSPKWLAGPVGVVRIMQESLKVGYTDALYWLGVISLSLGIFNLLPIPVLDGGHICLSLWEMITRKRISAKAMEKLVLPFVVLLILFFIYTTYQDISKIFMK